MLPRSQWTDAERVWFDLFKAALQGVTAHVGLETWTYDDIAKESAILARKAVAEVNKEIKPFEPEPLFDPLLRKKAAERKQTEEDSSFGVA